MLDFCSKHNIVCDIERINIDSVNEAMVGAGAGLVPPGLVHNELVGRVLGGAECWTWALCVVCEID